MGIGCEKREINNFWFKSIKGKGMRKIIIVMLFVVASVFGQESTCKIVQPKKSANPMLVGVCSRTDLENAPFGTWFNRVYNSYNPDFLNADEVKTKLTKFHITIVMGTWCPDSRREVPRFYKILDSISFPKDSVTLIAVDRRKKGLSNETEGLNIKRVPTFIFYENGAEKGRIIEHPSFDTLEDDIENILHSPKK